MTKPFAFASSYAARTQSGFRVSRFTSRPLRGLALSTLLVCGCHADWDEPSAGPEAGAAVTNVDGGARDSSVATAMDGSVVDANAADAAIDGAKLADAVVIPSGDATVAGFCSSVTKGPSTLCTDLEMGALVGPTGFDWVDEPNAPMLVNEGRPNGPRVMKSTLLGTNGDEGMRAVWTVEDNPKTMLASFDILPSVDITKTGSIVTVYKAQQTVESLKPAPDGGMREIYYPGVSLSARDVGVFVSIANSNGSEPPTYNEFPIMAAIPDGWFRVTVEIKYGTAGSVIVKYNDVEVLKVTNTLVQGNAKTYHQVGLYSFESKTAGSALYDNVLLDATN